MSEPDAVTFAIAVGTFAGSIGISWGITVSKWAAHDATIKDLKRIILSPTGELQFVTPARCEKDTEIIEQKFNREILALREAIDDYRKEVTTLIELMKGRRKIDGS